MAHSIQTFGGKSEVINDIDLIVFIVFALEIISELPEVESLRPLAEEWQSVLHQYGPGLVDLKVDRLLVTPEQERDFTTLLETILAEAAQYHDTIPASFLNNQASIPGVTFHDYKVSLLRDAVKRLELLVAKR